MFHVEQLWNTELFHTITPNSLALQTWGPLAAPWPKFQIAENYRQIMQN